jgi:hypothetical protein
MKLNGNYKKRRQTKKQPKKITTFLDRLPKNEKEYLERLIEVSKRCITGESESLDDLFSSQVNKLQKQLGDLRKRK